MPCPKKVQKKYTQRKDRNRQETKNFSFRPSLTYPVNGPTNATSKDTARRPKHQIAKTAPSARRHHPKRGRFTENLSIYVFSPAPNSLRQNPSNFASHWLLYILLFFFFLILTGWMRGALCVATHLYILYQAADESTSGWEFFGNS